MSYKSEFLREASARGFIHQGTDLEALDQKASQESIIGYNGFDPTATSLHVGHMIPIMLLRLFQRTGHKPLVIVGEATAKIGDPTGKNEARKVLSKEQVAENTKSIISTFSKFIKFGNGRTDAVVLNNATWLDPINYLDFLRDFGPLFTINRMITFDTVKSRLENNQPLSFLEFNYMLLQAYDFHYLHQAHKCILQLGGADQWGNIVNGVELVRKVSRETVFGLTAPLITTSSGAKMGKSEKGAVWLNRDLLPDYDFWQFWRNTQDADVGRFLRLFTDLSLEEIAKLDQLKGEELNEAKKILADEVTSLVRGKESLYSIHTTSSSLFSEKSTAYTIEGKDQDGNAILNTSLPVVDISLNNFKNTPIYTLLVMSNLAQSNGEARRLIRGRGVKTQDITVEDENMFLDNIDSKDNIYKVSVGKKKNVLIRVVS